jgi:hypothetical protein
LPPGYAKRWNTQYPCGFLFVVNEFILGDYVSSPDSWGNAGPPTDPKYYDHEIPGTVFRYDNGKVRKAAGCQWVRQWGQPGYIAYYNPNAREYQQAPKYREHTVFSCSGLLPAVATEADASLGGTCVRSCLNGHCDPSGLYDWGLLSFEEKHGTDAALMGVSFVNCRALGPHKVLGKDAKWIPSLVPRAFANSGTQFQHPISKGLSGDIGIVIGLMAFHGDLRKASDVFTKRSDGTYKWDYNKWNGSEKAPKASESSFRRPCCMSGPAHTLQRLAMTRTSRHAGSTFMLPTIRRAHTRMRHVWQLLRTLGFWSRVDALGSSSRR